MPRILCFYFNDLMKIILNLRQSEKKAEAKCRMPDGCSWLRPRKISSRLDYYEKWLGSSLQRFCSDMRMVCRTICTSCRCRDPALRRRLWHEKRHFFDTCLTNYGARWFRDLFSLAGEFVSLAADADAAGQPVWFPVETYASPVRRRCRLRTGGTGLCAGIC